MKQRSMTRTMAFLLAFLIICTSVLTIVPTEAKAAPNATKITLSAKKQTLYTGKSFKLKVKKVSPSNASKAVTYKTSNKKVASVNKSGKVTAKKKGKATITVTSKTNKKVTAKCVVTVKQGVTKITTAPTLSLKKGGSATLSYTLTPAKPANKKVNFSSSNTSVATVDANGKVTAVAAGTATITISSADGCAKASVAVTVVEGGAVVTPNANSKTGYTVSFAYQDEKATNVKIMGSFHFSVENDEKVYNNGTGLKEGEKVTDHYVSPQDWSKDKNLWHINDSSYIEDMKKEGSTWTYSIDLTGGYYLYQYQVSYDNGKTYETIGDPDNIPYCNTLGAKQVRSQFYVPYDEAKQSPNDNWTFATAAENESDRGTLIHTTYPGINNENRAMEIYLPAHYHKNRKEPYKVIYMSHGAGGDEADWLYQGHAGNIMDRLAAEGKCEEFIIVTMDNTALKWNYDDIFNNVKNYMIPYMEANYNVSKEKDGRAFAGLSAGGATTVEMFQRDPSLFGYFGIFSGARTNNFPELDDYNAYAEPSLYLAAGWGDFGLGANGGFGVLPYGEKLNEVGLSYNSGQGAYVVQGGHDWFTWPLIIKDYFVNNLWQSSGASVRENSASKTGYTVDFTYQNSKATNVQIMGGFEFSLKDDPNMHNGGSATVKPEDWNKNDNLWHVNDSSYIADMTKVGDLWTYSLDLTGGYYLYKYRVSYDNGETYEEITDPGNLPSCNLKGAKQDRSQFYVPYNSLKQAPQDDWTFASPAENESDRGTMIHTTHPGFGNEDRSIEIYLPAHYDANRAEPYKVLYMSHGAGGDEADWLYQGHAGNIMDRLVTAGKCEEFIIVTMNNTPFKWNYDNIFDNVTNYMIPYMEANYNVSKDREDRAFAGLSMGGITTTEMFNRDIASGNPLFGYFGIFSGAMSGLPELEDYSAYAEPSLYLAAGWADFGLGLNGGFGVMPYADQLDNAGLSYNDGQGICVVQGGHDWFTWPLIIKDYFASQLWQPSGVTVKENATSNTGYTVDFKYRNANATNVQIMGGFEFSVKDDPRMESGGSATVKPQNWSNDKNLWHVNDSSYIADMTKEGNVWTYSIDLTGGYYLYKYKVSYDYGKTYTEITDPGNLPGCNLKGAKQDRSQFYVPYNAAKQAPQDNWTFAAPAEKESDRGTMIHTTHPGFGNEDRSIEIYLPAHYDANRAEPYNVLYMSHGAGGDEADWLYQGHAGNIMDRLAAEGKCKEFIIVTMNNTAISWNYDNIYDNVKNYMIPYMEANYNVSKDSAGRAFAGLSAGGMTTTELYKRDPVLFSNFGIFSGSSVGSFPETNDYTQYKKPSLYLAAGWADFGLGKLDTPSGFGVRSYAEKLDGAGITYNNGNGVAIVQGGHDWFTWPLIIKDYFPTLWK